MERMVGLFEEKRGQLSMGRVLAFMFGITAVVTAVLGIIFRFEGTPYIVSAFVGAGVMTKVGQKYAEKNQRHF